MDSSARPTLKLTPDLALGYLRELSCDDLTGCVLDRDGTRLAGIAVAGDAARALASELAPEATLRAQGSGRQLFAAASATHVAVVATGPLALPGLVLHDLGAMLDALSPRSDAAMAESPAAATARSAEIRLASPVSDTADGRDSALQRACAALLSDLRPVS